MSTNPDDFLSSLDVSDAEEMPLEPEAPPAEPAAEAAPAEPVQERARDAQTGQFVPQPPKDMPDPVRAAERPAEEQRVIPLAAHLEERRVLREENRNLSDQLRALNERLAKLETPPPAPEPSFIDDPQKYIDTKLEKTQEQLKQVEEKATTAAQQTELQNFLQHVATVESEFVAKQDDYYAALAHVRTARATQLAELFPQASQEEIVQTIKSEEIRLAAQLLQQGRNPAETIYNQAQKVYGYRPAQKAAPAPVPAPPPSTRPVGDPGATLGSSGSSPGDGDLQELDGSDDETPEGVLKQLRGRFQR